MFIAMAGLHGCMPNYTGEYASYELAIDDLAQLHELETVDIDTLRQHGYLELNLEKHGNAYCEITEEENDVEITHPVKPIWCDGCDAYHVECESGCCVIQK